MFEDSMQALERARASILKDPAFTDPAQPWLCTVALWPQEQAPEAAALKLFRPHWRQEETDGKSTGVFFSVWVDEDCLKKRMLHYNLHALRLRLRRLSGHVLESRKFAETFRASFGPRSSSWPHVKMAFGPQTLFQGHLKCRPERLDDAAFALARKFHALAALVDAQLARAAKSGSALPALA